MDRSTTNRNHCCNLGCLNVCFTFEHSLHVKIIFNDCIELNFHKQAVDLLSTVINLSYKEELLKKSENILGYS